MSIPGLRISNYCVKYLVIIFACRVVASGETAADMAGEYAIQCTEKHAQNDYQITDDERDSVFRSYISFGNCFNYLMELKNQSEPWKVPFGIFHRMAVSLLKQAQHIIESQEYQTLHTILSRELGTLDYESFLMFCDLLSIATTPREDRFSRGNNTLFDAHRSDMYLMMWRLSFEDYRATFGELANKFTQKATSFLGHAQLFPHVVLLPYPFDLTDTEIVLSMPTPGGNSTFLLGLNLRKSRTSIADGWALSAMDWFGHDGLHWSIFRFVVGSYVLPYSAMLKTGALERHQRLHKRAVELYFKLLLACQKMIIAGPSADVGEDERALYERVLSFFAFYIFHEERYDLLHRLSVLEGKLQFVPEHELKAFSNERYYVPLLPKECHGLSWDKLYPLLQQYYELFIKEFHLFLGTMEAEYDLLDELNKLTTDLSESDFVDKLRFDPSGYHSTCMIDIEQPSPWGPMEIRLIPPRVALSCNLKLDEPLVRFTIENPFILDKHQEGFFEFFCNLAYEISFPTKWTADKVIDRFGTTSLMLASALDDEKLSDMVTNANLDAQNSFGETALFYAANFGQVNAIKLLLKHGANQEIKDIRKDTYLCPAVLMKNRAFLQELLSQNVEISHTVLQQAALLALSGDLANIAKVILSKLDINCFCNESQATLFYRVCQHIPSLAIELIKTAKPLVNIVNDGQATPLMWAVQENHQALVDELMAYGADINIKNPQSATALSVALHNRDFGLAQRLIDHGADINYIDNRGLTLLECAVKNKDEEKAQFLVDSGAHVSYAVLNECIETKPFSMLSILLAKPLDLNNVNDQASLPLLTAVLEGYIDDVKILLDHGADPNLVGTIGGSETSALRLVIDANDWPEAIELFEKYSTH